MTRVNDLGEPHAPAPSPGPNNPTGTGEFDDPPPDRHWRLPRLQHVGEGPPHVGVQVVQRRRVAKDEPVLRAADGLGDPVTVGKAVAARLDGIRPMPAQTRRSRADQPAERGMGPSLPARRQPPTGKLLARSTNDRHSHRRIADPYFGESRTPICTYSLTYSFTAVAAPAHSTSTTPARSPRTSRAGGAFLPPGRSRNPHDSEIIPRSGR